MMVLDTHAFLWYLLDDPNLPAATRDKMQRSPEAVFVPSICTWELMMLAEQGRIQLPKGQPDRILRNYLRSTGFKEAPLTFDIALLSRTLSFTHEDPADRFIAATAKFLGFPLATADKRLRDLGWLSLAY